MVDIAAQDGRCCCVWRARVQILDVGCEGWTQGEVRGVAVVVSTVGLVVGQLGESLESREAEGENRKPWNRPRAR